MNRKPSMPFNRSAAFTCCRIGLAAIIIFSTCSPSMADYCGTTDDLIKGRFTSQLSTDDLVVADASRSQAQSIEFIGIFQIDMSIDSKPGIFLAQLSVYRIFASHVFYGDKNLQGREMNILRLDPCEDWGCELHEESLSEIKKDIIGRNQASSISKNDKNNNFLDTEITPPYRV